MTGLYFYKLVSPYEDDVTKDCKLTVNEIDHNFVTLKDADINDAVYDDLSNKITLTRNNGDSMEVDISSIVDGMTTNLEVEYDSVEGTITITYNDKKAVINGIITKDNLSKEILTEVISDSTLKGNGTHTDPLGISFVEKTGQYKPAKKFVNLAKGEFLPNPKNLTIGDSFVTYEFSNDYGFLYNYDAVTKINEDLRHGWRVPAKSDWDAMLNAIEPCDADKTHDSQTANTMLGKVAGKFLKDKYRWAECVSSDTTCSCSCDCDCNCNQDEEFDVIDENTEPKKKTISPKGTDKFKMGLLPAGYGDGCNVMAYFNKRGEYWSSTITSALDVYTKRFDYNKAGVVQNLESPSCLLSIRLVKDYDGKNFHEVENILGQDCPCVLLPCVDSKYGFAIWTAVNFANPSVRYKGVLPNNGEDLGRGSRPSYNIYVWTGNDFVKKAMEEGDSIVLLQGLSDEHNGEYRLCHGKLVSVTDMVYEEVMKAIEPRLDKAEERLDTIDDEIENINKEIEDLQKESSGVEQKLDQEILDRQTVDAQMWEAISGETMAREQVEAQIWEAINDEVSARTSVESQLWVSLNNEVSNRLQVEKNLWDAVNAEASGRSETEAQLWDAINTEVSGRAAVEAELWDAVNAESEARETTDTALWDAVNAEASGRSETEAQLWDAINTEVSSRTDVDAQMWDAINTEVSGRAEVETQIWTALNGEIERAVAEDKYLQDRTLTAEGSSFDCANGKLTLATENPDNTITIALTSNYGTF